ncbi:hypothetical protein LINGRAHAP2_LOCUS22365 [Linum grandiflorum]
MFKCQRLLLANSNNRFWITGLEFSRIDLTGWDYCNRFGGVNSLGMCFEPFSPGVSVEESCEPFPESTVERLEEEDVELYQLKDEVDFPPLSH